MFVLAAAGDPLFSLAYTREVFDRIVAPTKELIVLDIDEHLIFDVAPEVVLETLVPRLLGYAKVMPAGTVNTGGLPATSRGGSCSGREPPTTDAERAAN